MSEPNRGPVPASRMPAPGQVQPRIVGTTNPEPEKPPDPFAPLEPEQVPESFETEKVFTLRRPVMRHSAIPGQGAERIMTLTLKAPSGLDLFEVGGLPHKTTWNPAGMQTEMDIDRTKAWLSRLSGHNTGLLSQLHAADLRSMYDWLVRQLNPAGN